MITVQTHRATPLLFTYSFPGTLKIMSDILKFNSMAIICESLLGVISGKIGQIVGST